MVPYLLNSLLIHYFSYLIESRVRMIPHGILDTDLHMDYNSVFSQKDSYLSGTQSPNYLDLQRILSLSAAYAPSLTISSFIGPLSVDSAAIFANFLISLIPKFSKGAFQKEAATASAHVEITEDILDIDDSILRATGSILSTIQLKQSANKHSRFNAERCARLFSEDPNYSILLELASIGAIIDTDPNFIPQCVPEDFRHSEIALTKVFQKHALDSWVKGRGLLIREETLQSTGEIKLLHFNSNHLVFKPTDDFGRWCIDPFHRSDDNMPLNGGIAKFLSIEHYQKTWTASLVDMLSAFHRRKLSSNLPWHFFRLFKEDIKSCFPQMDMSPTSAILLAMRITATIIFIHLAGSFGWTGAPMAWSIIGSAMLRLCVVHFEDRIDLFLICDDFVGFGLINDTVTASAFVRSLILDVCGPDSVSLDKSVLSQQAEVIGWYIDLRDPILGASIRPKTDAIHKMCFYFFSFDLNVAQPLVLWQILQSFAECYSQAIRGFRCHVAAFGHMIRCTGPNPIKSSSRSLYVIKHQYAHKKIATPSAAFAVVMWRIACYLMFRNPSCMAMSIEQFLSYHGDSNSGIEFDSVSDASPYRICAALYHHQTNILIGWTSVKLCNVEDSGNRFQCSREYLGLILTFILIGKIFPNRLGKTSSPPIPFKWVNDNTGAIAWADKHKASSLASITANMLVSSFQLLSNITLLGSEHLPGVQMGDIDHESRKEAHILAGDYSVPSLLPELYINLESSYDIMSIISDCSPSHADNLKEKDFHAIFHRTQTSLVKIFPTLSLQ